MLNRVLDFLFSLMEFLLRALYNIWLLDYQQCIFQLLHLLRKLYNALWILFIFNDVSIFAFSGDVFNNSIGISLFSFSIFYSFSATLTYIFSSNIYYHSSSAKFVETCRTIFFYDFYCLIRFFYAFCRCFIIL